jgi:hypothetical protein
MDQIASVLFVQNIPPGLVNFAEQMVVVKNQPVLVPLHIPQQIKGTLRCHDRGANRPPVLSINMADIQAALLSAMALALHGPFSSQPLNDTDADKTANGITE